MGDARRLIGRINRTQNRLEKTARNTADSAHVKTFYGSYWRGDLVEEMRSLLEDLTAATTDEPDEFQAARGMYAGFLKDVRHFEEAAKVYERMLADRPWDAHAKGGLAKQRAAMGDLESALALAAELREDPNTSSFFKLDDEVLVEIYEEQRRLDDG